MRSGCHRQQPDRPHGGGVKAARQAEIATQEGIQQKVVPALNGRARVDVSRVAVVEDSPGDAMLITDLLNEGWSGELQILHFERIEQACRALANERIDFMLLDLSLPDARGLEALKRVRTADERIPVIVLTGLEEESYAIDALRIGAQDYLIKGTIDAPTLRRSVRYAEERARMGAELARQALYDPLTQLPNRALFQDRLTQAIARSRRIDQPFGLLFCDLDAFKEVNDRFGHDGGDEVLIEVARRLSESLRASDTAARVGGDEFALLCESLVDGDHAVALAQRVARTMSERPIRFSRGSASLGVSIGIALGSGQSRPEDVLRHADAAMYRAKQGTTGFTLSGDLLEAEVEERRTVEDGLRAAIARDELRIELQPQVWLDQGHLWGFEALLRWDHPTLGTLNPARFLPIAERAGLMPAIGYWVMRAACRQLRRWHVVGKHEDAIMSVNLAAASLLEPDFARHTLSIVDEAGIQPSSLCLEVNETCVSRELAAAEAGLAELRAAGVKLAIDDFGTASTSLNSLAALDFDLLKIDRSVIQGLTHDRASQRLVEAVGGTARALRVTPLAEGVETEEEAEAARRLGCRLAQGFHFGVPGAPDAVSGAWER